MIDVSTTFHISIFFAHPKVYTCRIFHFAIGGDSFTNNIYCKTRHLQIFTTPSNNFPFLSKSPNTNAAKSTTLRSTMTSAQKTSVYRRAQRGPEQQPFKVRHRTQGCVGAIRLHLNIVPSSRRYIVAFFPSGAPGLAGLWLGTTPTSAAPRLEITV